MADEPTKAKEPSFDDPEIAREYDAWSAATALDRLDEQQRREVEELAERMRNERGRKR